MFMTTVQERAGHGGQGEEKTHRFQGISTIVIAS